MPARENNEDDDGMEKEFSFIVCIVDRVSCPVLFYLSCMSHLVLVNKGTSSQRL